MLSRSVELTPGSEINVGMPHVLFDTGIKPFPDWGKQYAVSPDGQRFLLLKPVAEAAPTPITVVLNWTAGLKK